MVKVLFWSAVACAVLGVNAAEGSLFFFFTAHLTMLTVGYALYRRERSGQAEAASQPAAKGAAGRSKTKSA